MMIRLVGDSHTRALLDALELAPHYENELKIVPLGSANYFYSDFFRTVDSGVEFTVPLFAANLQNGFGVDRISPEVDVVWALSMAFHSARFFRAKMWKRFAPVGAATKYQQELSAAAIRQIVVGELQHMLNFFEALKASGTPFFIVSAPPPPDHHRRFRSKRMRRMAVIANATYRSELEAIFTERGIPFLLPPEGAADAEGLLLKHYNNRKARDQHHANEEYGALMLPRIVEFARALLTQHVSVDARPHHAEPFVTTA